MLLRTGRKKKLLKRAKFLKLLKLLKKYAMIQLEHLQTSFSTCLMHFRSNLMLSENSP